MLFFESEINKKNKKVHINKTVDVILIPSREELITYGDDLWHDCDELEKFKNEAIMELKCYANIKNITLREAQRTIYQ